jgi:hypothetical protein
LLPSRAETAAVERKAAQAIGDFAAAIGCSQHHHAPQSLGPMFRQIDARQQAAHGMANEVDLAFGVTDEASDRRMNVFGELFE